MSRQGDILRHNARVSADIAKGYRRKGDLKAAAQHERESKAYARRAAQIDKKTRGFGEEE